MFPGGDLRRLLPESGADTGAYQVRFPLPLTMDEVQAELTEIRAGLARLISRFEPGRFQTVDGLVQAFGRRQTLARIHLREPAERYARVLRRTDAPTVH